VARGLKVLAVALVALPISIAPGVSAVSAVPPIAVTSVEPLAGRASVYVERVAAPYEGGSETWLLNLDVVLANKQTASQQLERVVIRYPGSAIESRTVEYSPRRPETRFTSFASQVVQVPETRVFPFPLAPSVSVSFHFEGYREPIVVSRPLVEWRSAVAGGAYRFPIDREDLPPGTYVSDDDTHVIGSGHRDSTSQRFAYDYGVFRWTGSSWSSVIEGSKPGRKRKNSDFLIWGVPIRAMADGWVQRCVSSIADQPPGVEGERGGNSYRIVHANGEVALYAHLQEGSVPPKLCPREDVDLRPNRVKVKAGQVLGLAGNTGRSSGPHLHVHLGTTGKTGEEGLPLVFRGVRVRDAGADGKGAAPCAAANKPFAPVTRAASGPWQLVDPLFRPGHDELAWHGIEDVCFQDLFESVTQSGYGLAWLSGFDAGGRTYFNVVVGRTAPQIVRIGLSESQYQTEIEAAVAAGFRPTHVESYVRGGGARYAFVAEKKSGPAYRAYHAATTAQHDGLVKQLTGQGMAPVAVSVVAVGGSRRYTALWEKRSVGAWRLSSGIPVAQYQSWLESEAKAGRTLVSVDAWMSGSKPMLSAIVASKAGSGYVARHGLTGAEYQAQYEAWRKKGLRTRAVTGYRVGGAVRYAALWR
jgi:hypothetical protein